MTSFARLPGACETRLKLHNHSFLGGQLSLAGLTACRRHKLNCVPDRVPETFKELRSSPVDAYSQYIRQPEEDISVLTGAVLIANHRYPDLKESDVIRELDLLAEGVRRKLGGSTYPLKICQTISQHLYQDLGFHGDRHGYYNPDNSCMNKVLADRKGIPISLSLLYIEVARRVGINVVGVNIPGHFMLTPVVEDLDVLIDAFSGGEVCFIEDAEETLSQLYGQRVKIHPQFDRWKAGLSPRLYLGRMLNNLKQIYIQSGQPEEVLTILQYLRATRPDSLEELRDEGLFLAQVHRYRECVLRLEQYLKMAPDAEDAEAVQAIIQRAQAAILEELL